MKLKIPADIKKQPNKPKKSQSAMQNNITKTIDKKNKYLLIVESASKAKTIEGFLGKDFKVVASIGHVRQLSPTVDGVTLKDDEINFQWVTDYKKIENLKQHIHHNLQKIYLATDMDREGEAISWHIASILKEKGFNLPMSRITFVEITKTAILDAFNYERSIDQDLVNAYFARVGLDHKVGFSLSPTLWRQFPILKNTSAGRVQSPSFLLVLDREIARKKFNKTLYYSINGKFNCQGNDFEGKLVSFEGEKIPEDFLDKNKIYEMNEKISKDFYVKEIKKKNVAVKPDAPFITSTFQQEASKTLGMKLVEIMKVAQELYEGIKINGKQRGLITYMRTDSINMSDEALKYIREYLSSNYPKELPEEPNIYKSKVKNAQEAHECIRPVYINLEPKSIKDQLTPEQFKIYNLIWKRSIASQMKNAIREQITFTIASKNAEFKTTTSIITFKGFLAIYEEQSEKKHLSIEEQNPVKLINTEVIEHETQPPARFTEASLLAELEKHGIGRPSTYTSIIETLIKRNYIERVQKQIAPTFRGIVIGTFLRKFFSHYMNYEFTAQIEEVLDEIASGKHCFSEFLKNFFTELVNTINSNKEMGNINSFQEVSSIINENMPEFCDSCNEKLQIRMKFSFFYFCEKCNKTIKMGQEESVVNNETKLVKTEAYQYLLYNGLKFYLPKNFKADMTIEENIQTIVSLPRIVGNIDNEAVTAGMSKYGFYIKHKNVYYTIDFTKLNKLDIESCQQIIEKGKTEYKNYKKDSDKDQKNEQIKKITDKIKKS